MGAELESAGASFISTSCVIVARFGEIEFRFGEKVGDFLIQTRGEVRVQSEKTSCEITEGVTYVGQCWQHVVGVIWTFEGLVGQAG